MSLVERDGQRNRCRRRRDKLRGETTAQWRARTPVAMTTAAELASAKRQPGRLTSDRGFTDGERGRDIAAVHRATIREAKAFTYRKPSHAHR